MEKKIDIDLLLKYDRTEFYNFIKENENKIIGFCYKMVNDMHIAEELAQEIFLSFYNALKKFKKESNINTFLYGIAKNTIYNYYRKKKTKKIFNFFLDEEKNENQPDISSEKYSPETDIIDKELTDKVKEAIQNLSVKYRTAIVLYTYENKSYKEISKIMGKSISAVESLIFRAREKLKKSLQDYIEN